MELLDLNDAEFICLECIEDNSEKLYQKFFESVFWGIYFDILILNRSIYDKIDFITDD